jgi:hypothetical protein
MKYERREKEHPRYLAEQAAVTGRGRITVLWSITVARRPQLLSLVVRTINKIWDT